MPIGVPAAIEVVISPVRDVETDVLILPSWEDDDLADLSELNAGEVGRVRTAREFTGRLYDIYVVPSSALRAKRIALVGAGRREDFNTERLRRLATVAALALKPRHIERAAFLV